MQKAASGKNIAYSVNIAITAVIIFGATFVPGVGLVTDYGMTIAGIFAGIIYGYCTAGIVLPSIMALIALGFSGFASVPEVLMMSFGSDTVLYIMAILLLSCTLQECKITDKLVIRLVSNDLVKGRPWVITITFLLASFVLGAFAALPAILICWALLSDLSERAGFKGGEKWPMMMIFGVIYAATCGVCVPSFAISIVSNYGLLSIVSQGALVLEPLRYMGWAFICAMVLIAVYVAFCVLVIRPDMTAIRNLDLGSIGNEPLTREQILTGLVFLVFVVGMILPSLLPAGTAVSIFFKTIGNSGWGLACLLAALLIQSAGRPLYEFGEIFAKGMIWDIVFMLATVFTIVAAIIDDSTGIPAMTGSVLLPLQQGMSPVVFLLVIVLIYSLLANFTNSVAVSMLFIPVLYMMGQGEGINMLLFTGMTTFISNLCFLMPSACVNTLLLRSQVRWVPMRWCTIFAVFAIVAAYAVMMLVGAPLSNIFFV